MSRVKTSKPNLKDQEKRTKEWPVVVYFWMFGLGALGYILSNVGLSGLPHEYHWATGVIGAVVGFGVGWVWYRWRGDII